MYRRSFIFSTASRTCLTDKLNRKLFESTGFNLPIVWLNTSPVSQQHARCMCGHTPLHRKTLHQTPNIPRHTAVLNMTTTNGGRRKNYQGNKHSNKTLWLMLAGTGLFTYSAWKARHVLQNQKNPYIIYAASVEENTSSAASVEENTSSETKQSRLESNSPYMTEDNEEIPSYVPYLLIGAGTASHSAMRAIRLKDHKAQVLIVGDEDKNPYSRPPLSKELWYGEKTGVFYDPEAFYVEPEDLPSKPYGGVSVLKGRKVTKLDREKKIAYLDNGTKIEYGKCLIATGGRPKNLPVFEQAEKAVQKRVHVFRNIDDFLYIHRLAHTSKSIAVIGGGFLGSELACALGYKGESRGMKVYQIFPEKGVMSRVLPDYLSEFATEKIKLEGVDVLTEKSVKSASYSDKQVVLRLTDGSTVKVDHVVVAVGLQPNDDIAKRSDLEIDSVRGGVMVNPELEAKPDIWVAGDVASFFDYKYGRGRVEHHSVADAMGKLAGQNMAGARKLYKHRPYFWSDLGADVSYQAIGEVDSSLETYSVFLNLPRKYKTKDEESSEKEGTNSESSKNTVISQVTDKEDFLQGVVFYCKEGIIVGIVLWNIFGRGKINAARQFIGLLNHMLIRRNGSKGLNRIGNSQILEKNKELKNEDLYELSKLLFRSYAKPS